jgi:catechol 2,3-dioxygenase-like lactoylglutathione lyase family enzyme
MPHFVDSNHQLVIELYVQDLNPSVSFYEQLGFRLGRRDGHFAQLAWEDHHFFLDEQAGLPQAFESPRVNVRVLVPNVDIYWQQVRDLGLQIISRLPTGPMG